MTVATVERTPATAVLEADETDAWDEYLESTRRAQPFRYDEVEPWAWARLQKRLKVVAARKAALRPARHVLDDGVALPDIATAEAAGADWCVWETQSRPGGRLETTVALALGVCTAMADQTVSGLTW